MLLNTLQNIAIFQQAIALFEQGSPPQDDQFERLQDKRYLRAMGMITAEIERIRTMKKPSRKSYNREKILEEMLVKSVGVDSLAEAEKALALAYRQRVSASIKGMLNRAERADEKRVLRAAIAAVKKESAREKATRLRAQLRARIRAREAREEKLFRKLDTRRKIIIGGTVVAAIRNGYPGDEALIERLQDNLGNSDYPGFRSFFAKSKDEEFLLDYLHGGEEFLLSKATTSREDLVKLYHEIEAKQEKVIDTSQSWNEAEQRQKRAMAAHHKIIVGGAVLSAIRKGDSAAPALLQLLDERISSMRDREAVRAVLPLAEFRPRDRL